MINPQRPNTGLPDCFLHEENVIICCGEDGGEVTCAFHSQFQEAPASYHEYRCYRFWKFKKFTLIWTGIGTGCLEPLLYEIFAAASLKKVILIGTSGSIPGKGIDPGEVFIAKKAYLGGAALRLPETIFPLRYHFNEDDLSTLGWKRRTIISTDFYYAFGPHPPAAMQAVVDEDVSLKHDLALYWEKAEAVDMEVGQFYYLCQKLGGGTVRYVALKGAANPVDAASQQVQLSQQVLHQTVHGALKLLGIPHDMKPVPPLPAEGPGGSAKLTEEIKLFWTIQIGVCAVLGYLGTTIDFHGGNFARILLVSVTSFLLLMIGSVYNLVANYYIRLCGYESEGTEQEDIVTPTLGKVYLIISGLIGAIFGYSLVHLLGYARAVLRRPGLRHL